MRGGPDSGRTTERVEAGHVMPCPGHGGILIYTFGSYLGLGNGDKLSS